MKGISLNEDINKHVRFALLPHVSPVPTWPAVPEVRVLRAAVYHLCTTFPVIERTSAAHFGQLQGG